MIVLTEELESSSYDALWAARLVVAMDSSIRCEALILNKPVISCGNPKNNDDYVVNLSPPNFIVDSIEYQQFAKMLAHAVDIVRLAKQVSIPVDLSDTSQLVAQQVLELS